MKSFYVFVLGLLLLGVGPVAAVEKTSPEIKDPKVLTEPISPGEQKVIAKLALQYNVLEQDIVNLRAQGLGYGEISHALVIANKTGETLGTIVALRTDGMGWGTIAKKYNLNLGQITKEAKKSEKLAGTYGTHHKPPMPEKGNRPEKTGRPEKPARPGK